MTIFYSKCTGGFYDSEIHGDKIPKDSVEISDELRSKLIAEQAKGKILRANDDGFPICEDPPPPTHEDILQSKLANLGSTMRRVIAAGFSSSGHVYQIRDIDISNFQSVLLAFALGETNPHSGVWRDINNVNVTINDTNMRALALAAITYHRDVLRTWSTKKDAVKLLTTEEAEAYDIDAGWPANGE